MADTLKSKYGAEIPKKIATMIEAVHPAFRSQSFIKEVLIGYEDLELMQRGAQIAATLKRHLPDHFPEAISILVQSMGPGLQQIEGNGLAPFLYMPHAMFVAQNGLAHFAASMQAQYEITQRFTAEFSIRPFIEQHPGATLKQLKKWATDPNHHVRRLVSEGTRPRLPWAGRLREFQRDPSPVIALLELLKDDESLYVRRSVANNLNDIGKDHPRLLTDIAARWMKDASPERQWIVRHALRSAIKRGDKAALAVLGFGGKNSCDISHAKITPKKMAIGGSVVITFNVTNNSKKSARAMVDFAIHFVKANGGSNAKVFKLNALDLQAGETIVLTKKVSLKEMTTRKHYPGRHRVSALVNGEEHMLGAFQLVQA